MTRPGSGKSRASLPVPSRVPRRQAGKMPVAQQVILLLVVLATGMAIWLLDDLPSPDDLSTAATTPSSKIYDRGGRLLYALTLYWQSYSCSPEGDPQASDSGHDCPRRPGFLQESWHRPSGNCTGCLVQRDPAGHEDERPMGGSTITQQLVRTLMLSSEERYEQTLRRKLREAFSGGPSAHRYSKGRDPHFLPERDLLWQPCLWRRATAQSLLWQARAGSGAGRVRDAYDASTGTGAMGILWSTSLMPNCARAPCSIGWWLRYIDTEGALLAKGEPLDFAAAPVRDPCTPLRDAGACVPGARTWAGAPAGRRPGDPYNAGRRPERGCARSATPPTGNDGSVQPRDSLSARRLQRQERGHCGAFALHGRGDCHGRQP